MLIAQISDLHTVAKNRHWLSEPATEIKERIERVVSTLNALDPAPDVVLLTGDATDDGLKASYDHLQALLKPLKLPLFVIPGNHDRREEMRAAFKDHAYIPANGFIHYAIDQYPVRLIGLDTLVEGAGGGFLCDERFSWLQQTLAHSKKPTLLFMHHPPIKIGMNLFDQIKCAAPAAFEKLVRENEKIIGVVTGHYHHVCVSSFGGKLCFLAPSVAPVHYFAHPDHNYVSALELEEPAITLHRWLGETMASQILRVREKVHRIDWAAIERGMQPVIDLN